MTTSPDPSVEPVFAQTLADTGFSLDDPKYLAATGTPSAPAALTQLAELLTEHAPEITGADDDWSVSVPCGHLAAVEADYDIEAGEWFVYTRSWAADHGLNSEDEIGRASTPDAAAEIMLDVLNRIAEADAKLEAQLAEAYAAEEQQS